MKRWRAAFLLALLGALPILFAWNRSADLLKDSDTEVTLTAIRAAHDPLRWVRGDWPLANGFYRPVPSLVFEADNALWRNDAAGYGLTNALLCFACVLLLFWALREIADRPLVATAGAALFAYWHNAFALPLAEIVGLVAWATLLVGAWRHRKAWKAYVPAFLTLLALSYESTGVETLRGRTLDWIPGRTATTMTVFALLAIAAYARFERLRRTPLAPPEPTPETPPATRNSEAGRARGAAWPWAVVAVLATALALASYEQAVMLPAVLLVVAFAFRLGGARPLWTLHGAFWSLLVGYVALRWAVLPHVESRYQHQQLRYSSAVFWAEASYAFPPLRELWGLSAAFGSGLLILLTGEIYATFGRMVVGVVGFVQARREPALALAGWLGSSLAFLPMAWVKPFEHYHYWPMAMRAAFVVAMGLVAFRLAATAWCPPARPAPPRPRPAPGSLPRP